MGAPDSAQNPGPCSEEVTSELRKGGRNSPRPAGEGGAAGGARESVQCRKQHVYRHRGGRTQSFVSCRNKMAVILVLKEN